MRGRRLLVRYADDAVLCFETKGDADRVMAVLPKRFEKYGLTVHPEKTKLMDMKRPGVGKRKHESFTFLGFKHFWAVSLKGHGIIRRKTDGKRLGRSLKNINAWIRENRHLSLREQQEAISLKLRGHYAYYGVTGNSGSIGDFYDKVEQLWWKWLRRRSNERAFSWERFRAVKKRFLLPRPRLVHSCYA
jgi:RNA-directed DNA polymerase